MWNQKYPSSWSRKLSESSSPRRHWKIYEAMRKRVFREWQVDDAKRQEMEARRVPGGVGHDGQPVGAPETPETRR
jgi:hypothetical protein